MRRAFKLSAIIAFMFAINGTAGAEPKVTVDKTRKSIVIEHDSPQYEYRVRFIDKENYVIYSERVVQNEIRDKKLDLTGLPSGNYVLTLENQLRIIEFMITIEKSGASLISKKIGYKPVFRKKEGRVYLNLLNSDLSTVDIEVRDAMGRLLFSETREGTLNVAKSFNFIKAYKGSYILKVKDGASVYTEEIDVY